MYLLELISGDDYEMLAYGEDSATLERVMPYYRKRLKPGERLRIRFYEI